MKRISLAFLLFLPACTAYMPTHEQGKHIVGDSRFGCISKDYFSTLTGYASNNDLEALKKGLLVGFLTGQCILFNNGEPVIVTDTSLFSGLTQIRREGDTGRYWTHAEAVK